MQRAFGFVLPVLFTAALAVSSFAQAPADPALTHDIATVKARYRDYFLQPDYPDAAKWQQAQQADGSWADVDYANEDVAAWAPGKHIDRVKQMASAYAKPGTPCYHSPKFLEGVEKGLQFWYARKPKSKNWWHNDIGQELQLERILILLDGQLPPDLVATGLTYFKDLSKPSKATGENLVWFAGEYVTHGVLTGNEQEIRTGIGIIQGTIVITELEGIQVDYSFHQHGPQLYSGGYGYGFLQDSSMWAFYVEGTRFAFAKDKIDLLSAYCLDGCRWMMRGPMFDYGANGRGLVRPPPKEPVPASARRDEYADQLAKLNPAKSADFLAIKAALRGTGDPCLIQGNKQFWRSDFMVQQAKDLYFSVKMNSSRTVGIETINGENLKGYWLPFGLTYIAPKGTEYAGIFPVWDWAHLPGVTSPTVVPPIKNNFSQPNAFVGGVSDGKNGACAMKLDLDLVHAKKAWFFFGDDVVALGAGISSTVEQPVDTTLNQTLLKGSVIADGKALEEGAHELKDTSWVLHNGIGYFFPEKADVTVGNRVQDGSYHSISSSIPEAPVSEKVFSLWLHHGVKPVDGKYAYIVAAGMDKKKMAEMATKNPFEILSNTPDLQAVEYLGTAQAIFYSPGELVLKSGMRVKVDQPCMLEIQSDKKGGMLTLASPTDGGKVNVSLNDKVIAFNLPTGQMAGSSQVKDAGIPSL